MSAARVLSYKWLWLRDASSRRGAAGRRAPPDDEDQRKGERDCQLL
jgi:hypothetical protein